MPFDLTNTRQARLSAHAIALCRSTLSSDTNFVTILLFGGPAHYMNAITQPKTFRRTSAVKWFGLPLYDIYLPAQTGDIKSLEEATARGVFAVGISAKGIVAIGVLARGMFTFGVGSFGILSVGVCSISLLLAGGTLAIAPIAFGVQAIGIVVGGVSALGWKVLFSVG